MKKKIISLLLVFMLCQSLGGCGNSGGDGKTTCRNCGRKTSLVAGFGYCNSCYEGFNDWQKRTYN